MDKWIAKNIVYKFLEIARSEKVSDKLNQITHIPYLSREEILQLQNEKLKRTLTTSYNNIPFYKKKFDQAGININLKIPEDIKKIPILTKEEARVNINDLTNPNIKVRVSKDITSGTSGNPFVVIKDRNRSAYLRAVMFRCYNQYDVTIGDKQARFWGVPIDKKEFIMEKLKDFLANRIRLSVFKINDENLHLIIKKLKKFQPKYFYGYPSVIYHLSHWMTINDITLKELNLSVIITTGEILYPFQRLSIEKVFKCKVANEYGTTESGILAFECPDGKLHINSDHVFLESLPSNGKNRILFTELYNQYNPLIRYDIGDVGRISYEPCTCDNNFPILTNLLGRDGTFIVTPENSYISDGLLEYILRSGVEQFQGIQKKRDELIIKIVKGDKLTDQMLERYVNKLRKFLGNSIKIKLEFVTNIEPEKSGKLRYFITDVIKNESTN